MSIAQLGVYNMFQSTPVIANGRIFGSPPVSTSIAMFQSTPVIANGRIASKTPRRCRLRLFQSTPVIANGRIRTSAVTGVGRPEVSIHARYC